MRLPSDKAVVRVVMDWGNRIAPILRLLGRLLTMTAMLFAVALQWFVHSATFQLGQGQGRAVAGVLGEASAIQAGFALLLCMIAASTTSDPQIHTKRPVGWAGLIAFGLILHAVACVPAAW